MNYQPDVFNSLDGQGRSFQANAVFAGGYIPYSGNLLENLQLTNSPNLNGLVTLDTSSQPGFARYIITTVGAVVGPAWVLLTKIPLVQPIPVDQYKIATSGIAGFTLVNGTGGIVCSAQIPNDNNLHFVTVAAVKVVTVGETGGAITLNVPGANSITLFAGSKVAGTYFGPDTAPTVQTQTFMCNPNNGTLFNLTQTSALTAGASKVWAEIWTS